MTNRIIRSQRKKAVSLAEVMIVLGIVSTVMVASISIMINSLIRIRVNDIEDSANSVMIKALEITKSPTKLQTRDDFGNRAIDTSIFVSLDEDFELQIQNGDSPIVSCSESDNYNVNQLLPEEIRTYTNVCVQVEIIPRNGVTGDRIYEIIVRTLYEIPGGKIKASVIKGYRYETF